MSRSLSDAARALGRKGGRVGGRATGPTKRRSPEHYAAMQARAREARRRAKDYVAAVAGGWAILRWDEARQIHVEGLRVYPSRYYALRAMREANAEEDRH